MLVNNDILWDLFNKKLILIDEMIKNNMEVTNVIQKVNFISSVPYKISQNFDKMLILLT